ncbi:Tetratricopeptide TPR_1 repeat-containing protein [Thermodesulfatator indicus DSM 15286]|uniref:Tetratricopeptide TPR_1 repeat-containing protein n=1 Tax=Thermodesulfatator indicus (strain DSM 15286 / JCM 11887 / CIR29812) TaxID=667014 RepID=F8A8X7_THEID|nr:tetratricopeptide repeat protein [Thermodesulfatator indicus]AEH44024.1 Tetratricopeptide TPR_1 repeat-containing protein [Thermodesulfatator indicus DSM 15286]
MKKVLFTLVLTFFLMGSSALALNVQQAFRDSYRYEKMASYQDAIDALLPVYQKYPKFYLVNLRLGWLYYLAGKYRNSIDYYEKALSIKPSSFEALLGLSLPYMAQKNWPKVEELMRRLIREDTYNYYGNLRLAIALRLQNKADHAERVMRKMLQRYPTSVLFLVELGQDLWWQGKQNEARRVFRQVLLLSPENIVAKNYLKK